VWTFDQRTGQIAHDGAYIATGYAGAGVGKNNPSAQAIHDVGPLPRGGYTITAPMDTRTHGPYVLWLEPAPSNEMFGRSGFGIHGDSVIHPGEASEGCIVTARIVREKIWLSGDHWLAVV
jgi:hypothetical protein